MIRVTFSDKWCVSISYDGSIKNEETHYFATYEEGKKWLLDHGYECLVSDVKNGKNFEMWSSRERRIFPIITYLKVHGCMDFEEIEMEKNSP